ncbi:MAG: hypothetical protein WCK29_00555 [archaeon]
MVKTPQKASKRESPKFLKGKFYGLYHNSGFKIDDENLLHEATYLAGMGGSYEQRISNLKDYVEIAATSISDNDRKYLITLENMLNEGLEQRAKKTKTDFYRTAKKGVAFQRELAGDSLELQGIIYEPKFKGVYTSEMIEDKITSGATAGKIPTRPLAINSEQVISPIDVALAMRNYNDLDTTKKNSRKNKFLTSLLVAGAFLIGTTLGCHYGAKNDSASGNDANNISCVKQNKVLPEQLSLIKIMGNTSAVGSTNQVNSSESEINPAFNLFYSLADNQANLTTMAAGLKNENNHSNNLGKKSLVDRIGNDVDKYRKYALTQGSREIQPSMKMAGKNLIGVVDNSIEALIFSYGIDGDKQLREDDFRMGKVSKNWAKSVGGFFRRIGGPITDRESYHGLNPVTGTINYLGRLIGGATKVAKDSINVATLGLGNNIIEPTLNAGKNVVESTKYVGQAGLNVMRLPAKNNETYNRILDWPMMVPLEWASNVLEMEGFSNTENTLQSVKDKGNTGVILEFGGDAFLLGKAIDKLSSDGKSGGNNGGSDGGDGGGVSGGDVGGTGGAH